MRECSYCGTNFSIVRDHVIPNSYLRSNYRKFEGDWIILSCRECNGILSDRLLFSVPERAAFILKRIEVKYKKIIKFPDWTEWEFEDVAENLANSIRATMDHKAELLDRISHLNLVSGYDFDYMRPET